MYLLHTSSSADDNSTATITTATAAPGCAAATTRTTETSAGRAGRCQPAAIHPASGASVSLPVPGAD